MIFMNRILKLKEVGLLNALKQRWLTEKTENDIKVYETEAIVIDQVSLIIKMMCCSTIITLIILAIEKIVYAYKFKRS